MGLGLVEHIMAGKRESGSTIRDVVGASKYQVYIHVWLVIQG